MHGLGFLKFTSGWTYEGEFKFDKVEGRGIFNWPNGDRYEGELKNNKKDGFGVFNFKNGNRYEGLFKDNLRHGQGSFQWRNGDKYEGEFKDDYKKEWLKLFWLSIIMNLIYWSFSEDKILINELHIKNIYNYYRICILNLNKLLHKTYPSCIQFQLLQNILSN